MSDQSHGGANPYLSLFPNPALNADVSTLDEEQQNGLRCTRCGYKFQKDAEKEVPPEATGGKANQRVCKNHVQCVVRSTQAEESGE